MRLCNGRCRRGLAAGQRFKNRFADGWRQIWPSSTGRVARLPAVRRLKVEGGWYAVLRIPALGPDEQTVLALLERGVWVHPGYFFGMPESGWLVVSLLAAEREFSNGVANLIDYFRTNQGGNILRDVSLTIC